MNIRLNIKTCLIIVGLALAALFVFKIPSSSLLYFGLILLCPLMHLFMMGNHGHDHEVQVKDHDRHKITKVEEGEILK